MTYVIVVLRVLVSERGRNVLLQIRVHLELLAFSVAVKVLLLCEPQFIIIRHRMKSQSQRSEDACAIDNYLDHIPFPKWHAWFLQ